MKKYALLILVILGSHLWLNSQTTTIVKYTIASYSTTFSNRDYSFEKLTSNLCTYSSSRFYYDCFDLNSLSDRDIQSIIEGVKGMEHIIMIQLIDEWTIDLSGAFSRSLIALCPMAEVGEKGDLQHLFYITFDKSAKVKLQ